MISDKAEHSIWSGDEQKLRNNVIGSRSKTTCLQTETILFEDYIIGMKGNAEDCGQFFIRDGLLFEMNDLARAADAVVRGSLEPGLLLGFKNHFRNRTW